ncbi:MAG: Hpt domain-containing protein [Magnetococcus sp. WYHC-3]
MEQEQESQRLCRFARDFTREARERITRLERWAARLRERPEEAEVREHILILAHGLLGGAQTFGYPRLVEVVRDLIALLGSCTTRPELPALGRMETLLNRLRTTARLELAEAQGTFDAPPPPPPNPGKPRCGCWWTPGIARRNGWIA